MKIREFLFVNAIIFNKNELNEIVEYLDNKVCEINKASGNYSYCEESIQLMIEEAFFSVDSKNSQSVEAFGLKKIYSKSYSMRKILFQLGD